MSGALSTPAPSPPSHTLIDRETRIPTPSSLGPSASQHLKFEDMDSDHIDSDNSDGAGSMSDIEIEADKDAITATEAEHDVRSPSVRAGKRLAAQALDHRGAGKQPMKGRRPAGGRGGGGGERVEFGGEKILDQDYSGKLTFDPFLELQQGPPAPPPAPAAAEQTTEAPAS